MQAAGSIIAIQSPGPCARTSYAECVIAYSKARSFATQCVRSHSLRSHDYFIVSFSSLDFVEWEIWGGSQNLTRLM